MAEIDAVEVPVLVVQGARDPFGMLDPTPSREVVVVEGDHSLRKANPEIERVLPGFLGRVLAR
jgi:predicted alpha/beta-hydrolase family hydrolase